MEKRLYLTIALVLLLLPIAFSYSIRFNQKAATDMVYAYAKGQATKLLAQNEKAELVLSLYNYMMNPDSYIDFAQSEVCKVDESVCQMVETFDKFKNYESYLKDPQNFFTNFMKEKFCQENKEACEAYQEAMSNYQQVKNTKDDPFGSAKSYAMYYAMSKANPGMKSKLSTLMLYKGYFDRLFIVEEDNKQESQQNNEQSDEQASNINGNVIAETETVTRHQIDISKVPSSYRRSCLIGFNFEAPFVGDVVNCVVKDDETDLSNLIGLRDGFIVTGKSCIVNKDESGLQVSTPALIDTKKGDTININQVTDCYVKVKNELYKNIVGAVVDIDDSFVKSGTFLVDKEGNLKHAEFMVGYEDTSYVFTINDERKRFKLKPGTIVVYDDGNVNLNFDYFFKFEYEQEPEFELYSFSKGKWVKDAIVSSATFAPVLVKPLEDGSYEIKGKFKVHTVSGKILEGDGDIVYRNEKDVVVRKKSIVSYSGALIKTSENDVELAVCSKSSASNSVSVCRTKASNNYIIKGAGFKACEMPGICYNLIKDGKVKVIINKNAETLKSKRSLDVEGDVEIEKNGQVLKQVNGKLIMKVPKKNSKLSNVVKALGANNLLNSLSISSSTARKECSEGMCNVRLNEAPTYVDAIMEIEDLAANIQAAIKQNTLTEALVNEFESSISEFKDRYSEEVQTNPKVKDTIALWEKDLTEAKSVLQMGTKNKVIDTLKDNMAVSIDPVTCTDMTFSDVELSLNGCGNQVSCLSSSLNAVTSNAVTDITGQATDDEEGCGEGNVRLKSSSPPEELEIEDCCLLGSCVCFNGNDLNSDAAKTKFNEETLMVETLVYVLGEKYTINLCTHKVVDEDNNLVGTLTQKQINILKANLNIEDRYNELIEDLPKKAGAYYAAPHGSFHFSRIFGGGYRCKDCPDSGAIFKACKEIEPASCRILFVNYEENCPEGTIRTKY